MKTNILRLNLLKVYFVFTASLYCLPTLADGGWTSNGGFTTLDQNNPWFVGDEKIPFCFKVSKSFGVGKTAAEFLIHQSSKRWEDFFERYQMNLGFPFSSYYSFADNSKKKVMTSFEASVDCQRTITLCTGDSVDEKACHEELKNKVLFLFGESNSVVEKYINLNGKAIGAAIRTEYDHQTRQSGGIVWISNKRKLNWSQISHLLLHEMGHVFGMKHDSCWVMSEDVGHFLEGWAGIGNLEQIESPTWPYSYKTGDTLLFTGTRVTFPPAPKGFFPNKYSLVGLTESLGFDKEGFFNLTAHVQWHTPGTIGLKVIFEEFPSGKKVEMTGKANSKNSLRSIVPTLYTAWKTKDSNSNYNTDYMDAGWVSDNLQGSLEYNGKKIPFLLDRKKGLTMSIFSDETGNWLNFGSIQQDVTTSSTKGLSPLK